MSDCNVWTHTQRDRHASHILELNQRIVLCGSNHNFLECFFTSTISTCGLRLNATQHATKAGSASGKPQSVLLYVQTVTQRTVDVAAAVGATPPASRGTCNPLKALNPDSKESVCCILVQCSCMGCNVL